MVRVRLSSLRAAALAHRQLLLPIEAKELLVAHDVPLACQRHNATAATATFICQRFHSFAKTTIVATAGFVTDRHSAIADGFPRPAYAVSIR